MTVPRVVKPYLAVGCAIGLIVMGCTDEPQPGSNGETGSSGGSTTDTGMETADSGTGTGTSTASSTTTLSSTSGAGSTGSSGPGDDTATDLGTEPRPEYEELFASDHLPVFELTIPPSSWDAIEAAGPSEQTYQPAVFKYQDIVLENVGLRLKGRASFQPLSDKPALKIKFGEFEDGQRFKGLRRLTLNNQIQDPSAAHERIGYQLYRAAGLPAPLCNSARVYINSEYIGLYANVQTLDKTFVEDHWPDLPVQNLYDTTNEVYFTDLDRSMDRDQAGPNQEDRFELETNTNLADLSDLTQVIDATYNGNRFRNWYSDELEQRVDIDQFLAVGGVQTVIGDWDGFFGARNNYKLYHAPDTSRFVLFPWGIDQTFEPPHIDDCIDGSSTGRVNALFFERCKNVPECWARYEVAVEQAVSAWDTIDLEAELDQIETQIADSVLEDPRSPYSYADWEGGMAEFRDFVAARRAPVMAQLAGAVCPQP